MKRTRNLLLLVLMFVFSNSMLQAQLSKVLSEVPDGFASLEGGTTGGAGGQVVTATTATEFLSYMDQAVPLIIQVKGTISYSGMKNCRSNKTIIGLGSDAAIDGGGVYMYKMNNIIIRNITFKNSSEDGVGITNSSTHIWVDHCNFTNCADGCLDIKEQSNYITVSYCKFYNHSKTMLIGHKDGNTADIGYLKVSIHHNWWDRTVQRHPRVRFGWVHVYNNYYDNDSLYGVVAACSSKVLVEGNYFKNIPVPMYSGYQDSPEGDLVERSNIYDGCGSPVIQVGSYKPTGYVMTDVPEVTYSYSLENTSNIPTIVQSQAGVGIITTDVTSENSEKVRDFTLNQNFPNPFNPQTSIQFQLAKEGNVTLKIFNDLGSEVKTVVNEVKQTGLYNYAIDMRNCPSGIYFFRLSTSGYSLTKKMLLLK
jgi:pectate lyase